MDAEQFAFNIWYKAHKQAEAYENEKKKGPLFKQRPDPQVDPGEFKCKNCGTPMAFGILRCKQALWNPATGEIRFCAKCREGLIHYGYRCKACSKMEDAEDVWSRKTHFFMYTPKAKVKLGL